MDPAKPKPVAHISDAFNNFLDRFVLPWPVRFLTTRVIILCTIALLLPLIVYASNTILVLSINSYLNTMSVAVSSIVLLYATISEARQKQIAELQEKRAQEDHAHVTEMHNIVLESLRNQHEEIHELKKILAVMNGQAYEPEELAPLPDLKDLHPLGDARFDATELQKRWRSQLHHNRLVSTLREDLTPGEKK